MWEAIRSNTRRSWVLITLMGIVLIALGGSIGMAIDPRPDGGGAIGMLVAALIWLLLWMVATAAGDGILLTGARAREISKSDAPQLWNVVEEMTIAAGLPKPPRIFLVDDNAPNAFAVGRNPEKAAVAVTTGLLRRLNRDELQGVVAHEISHIQNLDVRFMTLAGVMLGSIVMMSDMLLRALRHVRVGGGRRSSGGGGGGAAQLVFLLLAILLAIVGPLIAQILFFACSRKREFLADASAARLTRYPDGLASALEKISVSAASMTDVSRALAPLYTVSPLRNANSSSLFSTHPPIDARVRILRSMAGGAGYVDYETAYRKVLGDKKRCIGERTLQAGDAPVAIRTPSAETLEPQPETHRARQVSGILQRLDGLITVPCTCGLQIKVPPRFQQSDKVQCPRCGTYHPIPAAAASSAPQKTPSPASAAPLAYRRSSSGWESFRCRCGHTLQLSPGFSARQIACPRCRARVQID